MWFPTTPSELDYRNTAPFHLENVRVVRARPERVFDVFATGEGQTTWFQDFVACRWTSPEPHGVGATREIELRMLTVKERFLAWDRGKHLCFSIDAVTLPLAHGMLEDLQFEPAGEGETKVTWRVHYTPALAMRLVHPIARAVFGRMFTKSLEGLGRYLASNP